MLPENEKRKYTFTFCDKDFYRQSIIIQINTQSYLFFLEKDGIFLELSTDKLDDHLKIAFLFCTS